MGTDVRIDIQRLRLHWNHQLNTNEHFIRYFAELQWDKKEQNQDDNKEQDNNNNKKKDHNDEQFDSQQLIHKNKTHTIRNTFVLRLWCVQSIKRTNSDTIPLS